MEDEYFVNDQINWVLSRRDNWSVENKKRRSLPRSFGTPEKMIKISESRRKSMPIPIVRFIIRKPDQAFLRNARPIRPSFSTDQMSLRDNKTQRIPSRITVLQAKKTAGTYLAALIDYSLFIKLKLTDIGYTPVAASGQALPPASAF